MKIYALYTSIFYARKRYCILLRIYVYIPSVVCYLSKYFLHEISDFHARINSLPTFPKKEAKNTFVIFQASRVIPTLENSINQK